MIKATSDIVVTDFIIQVTAGENLTADDTVYISTADGKAYKTDADDNTKIDFIGFVQETTSINNSVNIVHTGLYDGLSGLTVGVPYWLSGTAGAITSTKPSHAVRVGNAVNATTIKIAPRNNVQTFLADGTWRKPTFGNYAKIQAWGAGGSGGNYDTADQGNGGGGGGGYTERIIPLDEMGATETITIGIGGAAVTTTANGNAGGNTTVGSHVTAYGGGGGGGTNAGQNAGGGGGGFSGVGGNAAGNTAGAAGAGVGAYAGGVGGVDANGGRGHFGGGGGGGSQTSSRDGGASEYGGGGGGNGRYFTGGTPGNGGVSKFGGNGGAGAAYTGTGVTGSVPGGGGGGSTRGTSGAGANGKVVITVF